MKACLRRAAAASSSGVVWALWGALLLSGGCLETPGGSGGESGPIDGAWAIEQGGCRQLIGFDGSGGFSFGVALSFPEGEAHESIHGQYAETGEANGAKALEILSDSEPQRDEIAYCAQWERRTERALPLDEAMLRLGTDARTLSYREEVSDALGPLLIGTAADRTDRFALFRRNGRLIGARLDGTAHYTLPLYAAWLDDAARYPFLTGGTQGFNVPEGVFSQTFDVASPGTLRVLALNVTAAADVTFTVESAGAVNPRCAFVVYPDLGFGSAVDPPPLDPALAEQTLRLDPGDPDAPLFGFTVSTPDGDETAYLLPLGVEGLETGACTVTATARATSAAVLEEIVADPAFSPVLRIPLEGDDAFAVAPARGHGEAPRRVRWNPGLLARGLDGLPERVGEAPPLARDAQGAPPFFDVLGLLEGDSQPILATVDDTGAASFLNLFPADQEGTGLGPFQPLEPQETPTELAYRAKRTAHLSAADTFRPFALSLATSRRVAIWSEGGLDSYATLQDPLGRNVGGDDDGAPDGKGFRIARTLPAGTYTLRVAARDAPGWVTVHVSAGGASPVSDEELEACLIANGLVREPAGSLTELACIGQGITSLSGLAATGSYRVLELAGNRIESLAPLAGFSELRVLSLADNGLRRAAGLTGLDQLHTLSLADNPLRNSALGALAGLAGTLRLLDLTGATTLSEAKVLALKALLPNTIVLTPDGEVLP